MRIGKVVLDKSISVDGFITGSNPGSDQPLGEGDDRGFIWIKAAGEARLLLAHPVPVVLARETTGVSLAAVFVPFAAEKLAFNIAFGALALDVLLIVVASSLLIKRLPRKVWRRLHYGAYAVSPSDCTTELCSPTDTPSIRSRYWLCRLVGDPASMAWQVRRPYTAS